VLRFELTLVCDGRSPTGNMQVRLDNAEVVDPVSDAIGAGDQTIPFKQVGNIKEPPPPPPPK
jgi:hypothetical protein